MTTTKIKIPTTQPEQKAKEALLKKGYQSALADVNQILIMVSHFDYELQRYWNSVKRNLEYLNQRGIK